MRIRVTLLAVLLSLPAALVRAEEDLPEAPVRLTDAAHIALVEAIRARIREPGIMRIERTLTDEAAPSWRVELVGRVDFDCAAMRVALTPQGRVLRTAEFVERSGDDFLADCEQWYFQGGPGLAAWSGETSPAAPPESSSPRDPDGWGDATGFERASERTPGLGAEAPRLAPEQETDAPEWGDPASWEADWDTEGSVEDEASGGLPEVEDSEESEDSDGPVVPGFPLLTQPT